MKLIIDKKQVHIDNKLKYNFPYISKYGEHYSKSTLVYEVCRTNNCSEKECCSYENCTLLEYNGYSIFICGKLRCDWLYI